MTTAEYTKPVPMQLNPSVSNVFYEAAQRGELMLPRCSHCGRIFWYSREQCPNPHCYTDARLGKDIEWQTVSQRGRLYSYSIIYDAEAAAPGFEDDVPYVLALVALEAGNGLRMFTNLVDCPLEDIKIDMPVVAAFDVITPDWTLVKFRPA